MIDGFDRDSRLRAISMNAVREARIAYGRADDPFTDDDALRAHSIYSLLHVQERIEPAYEHFPVVAKEQAPINPKIAQVANLLDQIDELPKAVDLDQNPPVALNLPKKAVG